LNSSEKWGYNNYRAMFGTFIMDNIMSLFGLIFSPTYRAYTGYDDDVKEID